MSTFHGQASDILGVAAHALPCTPLQRDLRVNMPEHNLGEKRAAGRRLRGTLFCLSYPSCSACLLQEEVTPHEAYEHSEMLLYRAMVLDEGGHHSEALTHLDLCEVSLRSAWEIHPSLG